MWGWRRGEWVVSQGQGDKAGSLEVEDLVMRKSKESFLRNVWKMRFE